MGFVVMQRILLVICVYWLAQVVSIPMEQVDTVIDRDVCIIGGGASGTYAAIRLQDLGKSVVVVEKEGNLGGHTHTYIDPVTNKTVDYGVVVFHDLQIVKDYFNRLGIPLKKTSPTPPPEEIIYADFKKGKYYPDYAAPDPQAALAAYGQQAAKYPDLEKGFYLPDQIPEDLLLPFGEFIQKYKLSDALPVIAYFGQGLGDITKQLTLYVLKNFGLDILRNIRVGFLGTTQENSQEVYDRALEILGSNVLLRSRVIRTNRSNDKRVEVYVSTPSGVKMIRAKKLLISIPPKLNNLHGFDLHKEEKGLFSQFQNTAYYTGLVTNSNLPILQNFQEIRSIGLTDMPLTYGIKVTAISGLVDVKYGSSFAMSEGDVRADIIASIERARPNRTTSKMYKQEEGKDEETPEFTTFQSHTPFELTVPREAIESGFYKRLYNLQGQQNTFYTGAAFHTHDSSLLWQFTEALLPRIMEE